MAIFLTRFDQFSSVHHHGFITGNNKGFGRPAYR